MVNYTEDKENSTITFIVNNDVFVKDFEDIAIFLIKFSKHVSNIQYESVTSNTINDTTEFTLRYIK